MSIIYLLIFISLLVAIGFLIAFLWAVKTGQFEDTYTPAIRILFDDDDDVDEEDTTNFDITNPQEGGK